MTRTYLNAFPDDEPWLIVGRSKQRPQWLPSQHAFVAVDVTKPLDTVLPSELITADIHDIVIGIRPPLISLQSNATILRHNLLLIRGLELFLKLLFKNNHNLKKSASTSNKIITIVHVSSIAAIDHGKEQLNWNESQTTNESLTYPYDIFKRECELVVERLVAQEYDADSSRIIIRYTNLRIGAIFSDAPNCIQCGALQTQALFACELPQLIDCNSARNVARCIHSILNDSSKARMEPVYYYTRCTNEPVPYASHLHDYQAATAKDRSFGIVSNWFPIHIPVRVAMAFFSLVHVAAKVLPCLHSVDYLLQVAVRSHTFDNSLVHGHFTFQQESILECFVRRREYLKQQ